MRALSADRPGNISCKEDIDMSETQNPTEIVTGVCVLGYLRRREPGARVDGDDFLI